jgi:hypothetical protein
MERPAGACPAADFLHPGPGAPYRKPTVGRPWDGAETKMRHERGIIRARAQGGTRSMGHREVLDIWWHASPVELLVGFARSQQVGREDGVPDVSQDPTVASAALSELRRSLWLCVCVCPARCRRSDTRKPRRPREARRGSGRELP